jgi:adenylate cyclase
MKRSTARRFGVSVFAAALLTAMLSFGVLYETEHAAANPLYRADAAFSDALFQREGLLSGEVTVIGIDARSLAEFGPFPWPRSVMAAAIRALNKDPARKPAAIGIDVLYTGESDAAADADLAEAVAEGGNVVVAVSGVFGDRLIAGDDFYMERGVVTSYDAPYARLAEAAAELGHINAMRDADGVLRHGLFFIDLPDGERVYSLASALCERYATQHGLATTEPRANARGAFYISFAALPGAFEVASVSDLLAGDILDTGRKIVLIGPYAAGLGDAVVTSLDHGVEMYGVEVHANIIEAFLAGNHKRELPALAQAVVVFLLSALCMLWFWDRKALSAALVWLLLACGGAAASVLLYDAGYVSRALWLPFSVTALYIATVVISYVRAALEKRRVTNLFKRYVAPEIVNEILKEGTDALGLGGKLCDVAVLFVDIRGFTPLSEALPPPRVVELLNRCLTLTADCVMRNGGTLDKFIGDATMAFWGAPLPQEDCVFKAVKAATDIRSGAKALERELFDVCGKAIGFGVGVHCGPAVVGNIGTAARMDYTAVGDTVNTAARLESNAPLGEIFVSRAVADALQGRVEFVSLGDSVKLKGKAEGFEVLRVVAVSG